MGLYLLLVLGTVLVVMLENRQPERTIAWVVAIVLLPVVGLVVFYFFGQNIRRKRRHRKKLREELHHQDKTVKGYLESDADTSDPFAPLKHLCSEEFGAPLQSLGGVTLMADGRQFVDALLQDFEKATQYIYLQTYIIEDDGVGRQMADALCQAAERGVDVRLLYDDVGCWRVPSRFFKAMVRRGVSVEAFMPVRFPSLTHKINYRNHRKICVVDGQWGYVGGMNLADRYLGHEGFIWRDMHLRLSGEAVMRLQDIFLADWALVTETPRIPHSTREALPAQAGSMGIPSSDEPDSKGASMPPVQIVTSGPASAVPQLMTAYTWATMHAQQYLYVQTPYFMPTEPFLHALKTVALAGTDVRLMVPRKPDGRLLRHINDSYVSELLAAGVRVFLYDGGFLHSKCMVMDDRWCAIGSANIDFRSFLNNIEVAALVYDADTAKSVRQRFETDLQHCTEVDAARWAHRSLFRRLQESATRILSPLF